MNQWRPIKGRTLGFFIDHIFAVWAWQTQEEVTLTVFILFAQIYLGENFRPKHLAGFVLLALAAWMMFQDHYGLHW